MYKLYCRIYQNIYRLASYFMSWRRPELIEGEDSLNRLPKLIKEKGIKNVLIVTDKGIRSIGLMDGLLKGLNEEAISFDVYDKTVPNPTIENIEEAFDIYKRKKCQAIIAFGGGSPIDCAKGVGARAARPDKTITQMRGQLKVRKNLPPLFAIPTTAGTGSEATVTAMIKDSKTHEKYAINDISLIPHYAVLDPKLTMNLPPHLTSTTGMDALTHAVEAYIGKSNTNETKQLSIDAIKLIFANIIDVYFDGKNLEARANMQKASYYAGLAFTRAYVGGVHATAHALGGLYGIPHGLANAVIMPYVLEYYGDSVYKPLAVLAETVGIVGAGETEEHKALQFVQAIKNLNKRMNIPDKIKEIREEDIPLLAERAAHEANPFYPVPKILLKSDFINIFKILK